MTPEVFFKWAFFGGIGIWVLGVGLAIAIGLIREALK